MTRTTRTTRVWASLLACAALAAGCAGDVAPDRAKAGSQPAEPGIEVAAFTSLHRLTPSVDVAGARSGQRIWLTAARGEREGAQLVAWASGGAARVELQATRLVAAEGSGSIPASRIQLHIQQPMRVERGSIGGKRGTYVDPLVPAAGLELRVSPTRRLLAWVDVDVPLDASPGRYTGRVVVRSAAAGRQLAEVPIGVHVRDVQLLHRPLLGSHVGVDASQMVRFEGVEAGSAELRRVHERYARLLADARLSVGDLGHPVPGALAGEPVAPRERAAIRRMLDARGVASVRVPFYMDYPFADPLGVDRPAAVRYLRAAGRWLRANGWLDRAFVYAVDEPDDSRAGEVRELHELLRDADPALRLLVTREASARAFAGSVDIWAPNIHPERFHPADVERERRAGRPTWWYPSFTTVAPYPTLFIDELRPTPRALGWLAWRHGVDGFLYWSATHWQEVDDPYRDSASFRESHAIGNGDGVLLYPGGPIGRPGSPVPSVRLLQLRDGIEDHELIARAACVASAAERRRLESLVTQAAPALDRIQPTDTQVQLLRSTAFTLLERRDSGVGCAARQVLR